MLKETNIKYITTNVTGIVTEKQKKLGIYKYLTPYDKQGQAYVRGNNTIFGKENAADMLFEYFYNNKGAKEIAEDYGVDNGIGFGMRHGATRVYCGFNTGKGKLKQLGLEPEKAKAMIAEAVEFVYE